MPDFFTALHRKHILTWNRLEQDNSVAAQTLGTDRKTPLIQIKQFMLAVGQLLSISSCLFDPAQTHLALAIEIQQELIDSLSFAPLPSLNGGPLTCDHVAARMSHQHMLSSLLKSDNLLAQPVVTTILLFEWLASITPMSLSDAVA